MTNDDAIRDLIERVEKAEGPDRELDAEIAIAIKWPPMGRMIRHWVNEEPLVLVSEGLDPHHYLAGHVCMKRLPDNGTWATPACTGSIDAAMTLVPGGWAFSLGEMMGLPLERRWRCHLRNHNEPYNPATCAWVDKDCATPALAICAASLRARLSTGA